MGAIKEILDKAEVVEVVGRGLIWKILRILVEAGARYKSHYPCTVHEGRSPRFRNERVSEKCKTTPPGPNWPAAIAWGICRRYFSPCLEGKYMCRVSVEDRLWPQPSNIFTLPDVVDWSVPLLTSGTSKPREAIREKNEREAYSR